MSSFTHQGLNIVKGAGNKVFINPNFKRQDIQATTSRQVVKMHVNPCFNQPPKLMSAKQKSKIYVNPNFIKPVQNQVLANQSRNPNPSRDRVPPVLPIQKDTSTPLLSKSRYSIVRQKDKSSNVMKQNIKQAGTLNNTIRINKYKSVLIKDVRKNLETARQINKTELNSTKNNKIMLSRENNKYKLTRLPQKSHAIVKELPKINERIKRYSISKLPISYKIIASKLKKNNIPCPLFKKYGRCLRRDNGKCNFLHDKKHVAICRKFLNGMCLDTNCLLSHDLTTNKMPTCYFYLKGMCTKEDCPYLHVKLNENTTVCSDFLKGYCDKGELCLKRHINIKPGSASQKSLKSRMSIRNKATKTVLKKKFTNIKPSQEELKDVPDKDSRDEDTIKSRYYKDAPNEDSDESVVEIKPTRVKIGTLPSFIRLAK